jgi:hypothetical protein
VRNIGSGEVRYEGGTAYVRDSGTVLALALALVLVSRADSGWCQGAVGRRILATIVLGMRVRMGLVECLAKGCRARQRYSWVKEGCWRSVSEQE